MKDELERVTGFVGEALRGEGERRARFAFQQVFKGGGGGGVRRGRGGRMARVLRTHGFSRFRHSGYIGRREIIRDSRAVAVGSRCAEKNRWSSSTTHGK